MEPISIIIMLLGVAILIALFLMSRSANNDASGARDMKIEEIKDADGHLATSIKSDSHENVSSESVVVSSGEDRHTQQDHQLVLFVAGESDVGLDGSRLLEVMSQQGLQYGDMDLFHRIVATDDGAVSLFRAANGTEPWTLNPDEIVNTQVPGISLILNLPSPVDDHQAIQDFIRVSRNIAEEMGATLVNKEQTPFSVDDEQAMLALIEL